MFKINLYGCDKYPAMYEPGPSPEWLSTRWGRLPLPVCSSPEAKPVTATVFFISFTVIVGFVLLSLTVAFVTSGIDKKLRDLQKEDELEEVLLFVLQNIFFYEINYYSDFRITLENYCRIWHFCLRVQRKTVRTLLRRYLCCSARSLPCAG